MPEEKVELGGQIFDRAEAAEALASVWALLRSVGATKKPSEKRGAAEFCLRGVEQGLFSPKRAPHVKRVCEVIISLANAEK